MKKRVVVATIRPWSIKNALKFKREHSKKYDVLIIKNREKLKYETIAAFKPDIIFFPHWSWIIPGKIYCNFECVVFHMTDLPFGRGGSPLQNLMVRGHKRTKISAIKVIKEMDAGPVYFKKALSLNGSAREIYGKASRIIFNDMIPRILKNGITPVRQKGRITVFNRRKTSDSRIPDSCGVGKVFDHIRMLDADGYPPAFIETKRLRFEFRGAKKYGKKIECIVRITERDKI